MTKVEMVIDLKYLQNINSRVDTLSLWNMKRLCNYCSVIDSGCIFKVIGLLLFLNMKMYSDLIKYFVVYQGWIVSEGRLTLILFNINNTLKMKNHKYVSITRINISNIFKIIHWYYHKVLLFYIKYLS